MAEQLAWENGWPQLNTLHTVGTLFIFRCFMGLGSGGPDARESGQTHGQTHSENTHSIFV